MIRTLENKSYLITGGNSGIGKSVVQELLGCGANVYVLDLNINYLESIKTQFDERLHFFTFDLSNLDSIKLIFSEIITPKFKFDGLVHCAGLSPLMKIEDNDIEKMLLTYKINVLCFIELLKFFYQEDISKQGASVVTMTSIATSTVPYRQAVYASSKSALEQVVRCAAKEFLARKIRVNAVSAGAVETEMFHKLENESNGIREKFEKYYPLGMISPKEISKLILFLLSEESNHIDGSIIRIDSGFFINK